MRKMVIAATLSAMALTTTAAQAQHSAQRSGSWSNSSARSSSSAHIAQRSWAGAQASQRSWNSGGAHIQRPTWNGNGAQQHRSRWGNAIGGRWYGGVDAPGGWNAYRRPARGWTLPRYWAAPNFFVYDYATYGLSAPTSGYSWSRYYDDAVLIDDGGRVYDSVSGIDWDRYADDGYAGGSYTDDGYDDRDARDSYVEEPVYSEERGSQRGRRDNGVGGAVIGGVLGGVAGNVIAGKGNRLGGTLIGAGVGAIAGTAIDRAEDRGPRYAEPQRYGADYAPPRGYDSSQFARKRYDVRDGRIDHGAMYDDGVTVTRTPGYSATRTYIAGPGTTTVVTVQPAVTTTTTTTEYVYETRAARPAKRYKLRSRQCTCVCKVVCR